MIETGLSAQLSRRLRNGVACVPNVGRLFQAHYRKWRRARNGKVFRTEQYWEARYASGGTCGPGSYGRLGRFKADVVNAFVREHGIQSVLELGSGDGAQLVLAKYPRYTGVDVSQTAVERCREAFKEDRTKSFYHVSERGKYGSQYELVLSLDVICHLVEDDLFDRYMRDLFDFADRFVIVYSSNFDQSKASHVRHRRFSCWIERHASGWRLCRTIANPYPRNSNDSDKDNTSLADFYIYRRMI